MSAAVEGLLRSIPGRRASPADMIHTLKGFVEGDLSTANLLWLKQCCFKTRGVSAEHYRAAEEACLLGWQKKMHEEGTLKRRRRKVLLGPCLKLLLLLLLLGLEPEASLERPAGQAQPQAGRPGGPQSCLC